MAEAGRYDVEVDGDVAMRTRDGVTLLADLYRPRGDGPFREIVATSCGRPPGKIGKFLEGFNPIGP